MKKLANSLFSLMLSLAAVNVAYATETVATYRAVDGPVEAIVRLNEGLMGEMTIRYSGHLYECWCGNYSCSGNTVDMVLVTRSGNPNANNSYYQKAEAQCRSLYGPGPREEGAIVEIGGIGSRTALWWSERDRKIWRESLGDLNHFYYGKDLPEVLLGPQVAIRNDQGQWDSKNGENYQLVFYRVDDQ